MGTAWHHGGRGGANTHVQHSTEKINNFQKLKDPLIGGHGEPSDFSSLSDFPLCPPTIARRLVLLVRCWDVVWLSGGDPWPLLLVTGCQ